MTQRQENIDSILTAARAAFGGDFNARGMLVGIEEGVASTVLPADDEALGNVIERNRTVPKSRDTSLGITIGRVLGHAHNIGSMHPTTEASNV